MITNKQNNFQYVGQTKNCVAQRFAQHIDAAYRYYKIKYTDFYKDIVESGENVFNNFEYKIIEECNDIDLDSREVYWIKKIKPLYNWSHRNKFLSDIYSDEICQMYKNGYTVTEIREKYRCRHKEITKILKDNGFSVLHSRPSTKRRKKVYYFDDYGNLIAEYNYAAECATYLGTTRDNVRLCALNNEKKGCLYYNCNKKYVSYIKEQPYIYELINHENGEKLMLKTKRAVELEIESRIGKFIYFSQIYRKGRKTIYGYEVKPIVYKEKENENEIIS